MLVTLAGCTSTVTGTGTFGAPAPTGAPTSGAPTGSPTASAASAASGCPGGAITADGADLAGALPTTTPRGFTPEPDRDGPLTLDELLAYQPVGQRSTVRGALVSAGFTDAFERAWMDPGVAGRPSSEAFLIYHFATAAGACRFAAFERALFSFTPRAGSTVPGAEGSESRTSDYWQATSTATKGTYVIEANALSFDAPVVPWTVSLLTATYAAL